MPVRLFDGQRARRTLGLRFHACQALACGMPAERGAALRPPLARLGLIYDWINERRVGV